MEVKMIVEVILPKIGMAMQDAIIVTWWKEEGDTVKNEEPLFDMETEKVTETINSPTDGIVKKIYYLEGDTVDIGEVVAEIQVGEEEKTESKEQQVVEAKSKPEVITTPAVVSVEIDEVLSFSAMRQTIARKMKESLENSAQLTLMREVDVTNLVNQRELNLKNQNVTFTDIFSFLVSQELLKFPILNSKLDDNKIVTSGNVNLGLAVALQDGLIVPVIKEANRKTIYEIAEERTLLVNKVKTGKFTNDDISGGTFTITNLGNYGIELFTPIINLPEVVILGLGRIVKKPVVVDNEILIRSMIGLSLTIDHRVVDGAPGAEFLESLAKTFQTAEIK
jgi:pyruvate dehydrogenase E2 component (dihydrolipoamide acetyltransferase)